ncbi:UNVERIFIED_CONTAM: hypothetical protein Sangu_2538400 [Sesamum angustifolium]|uniref:Uncharacterized protein n=1 Tax=Sesamum angustifolium TaxID=2727405 RepID=A0AAW2JAV3_9LAMI
MINELMLLYDNNVQGNSNAGNGTATKEKSHQQRDGQYQPDGYLRGQGMNIFEDNNISNNPSIFNPPDRFDQCKIMNLPFNPKPAENFQLMFSSPFNASSSIIQKHFQEFQGITCRSKMLPVLRRTSQIPCSSQHSRYHDELYLFDTLLSI